MTTPNRPSHPMTQTAADHYRRIQDAAQCHIPGYSISATGELTIDSQDGGYATPSVSLRVGPSEWTELHEMAQTLIGRPGFENGKTGVTIEVTMRIVPATCQPNLDSSE